ARAGPDVAQEPSWPDSIPRRRPRAAVPRAAHPCTEIVCGLRRRLYAIRHGLQAELSAVVASGARQREWSRPPRSQALPGNPLPARLCLASTIAEARTARQAEPARQCVPRQSLGTRCASEASGLLVAVTGFNPKLPKLGGQSSSA